MVLFIGCNSTDEQKLQDLMGVATSTKTKLADLGNQAFDFNPSIYNFGNRAVNSAPVTTTITIRNKYTKRLFISTIAGLSGAFSLVSDNCPRSPSSIDPDSTCSATVSFSPTTAIAYSASLVITYGETEGENSYTASMGISGTGTGSLTFTGIDSVSDIYSTQLKLNWTNDPAALVYYVFKVNNDNSVTLLNTVLAPATSKIVSGLTANTSYRLWVRATGLDGNFDANSNVVTTSTNNTPPSPVLNGFANYIYPSSEVALGSNLAFDVDDARTGSNTDTGVTYSCSYDQTVDAAVATTGNCSSLSGTASFNTTTGAFSWTPVSPSAIGFYEFKIIVTDSTSLLTDVEIFTANVRPNYSSTNLIADFAAMFANTTLPHTTGTTWEDLSGNNYDGTLTNFTFGGSYGWQGTGVSSNPYRLVFDGINDYVDLGSTASTATNLTYETWYKPTALTTPVGHIISNGSASNKGMTLREAKGYRNRVEAIVGNKNYADEVISDNPVAYLRMGDVAGDTIYDLGSAGSIWSLTNVGGYEYPGVLDGNDKTFYFNGTSTVLKTNNNVSLNPNGWPGISHEAWVKFTANQNSMIIGQGPENGTNAFFFILFYNNTIYYEYTDGIGVGWRGITYSFTPTLNTWYHIVTTFDLTNAAYKLFINGVNVQSVTAGFFPISSNMIDKTLYVGSYNGGASYVFPGYIDEPALYNYVLQPSRVTAHYNARTNYYSVLSNRLTNSTFNHLVSKFDTSSQSLYLYSNSNLDGAVSAAAININGTTANLSLAAQLPSAGSPTAGTYSAGEYGAVRVYDTALSHSTIKSNMDSEREIYEIPKSVAGLNLWLKADAITGLSDGDPVSSWSDSSTVGRTVSQATAGFRPTYRINAVNGKPAVRFDGVDDQMNIGGTDTSWTVFIAYKINAVRPASMMHAMTGTNFLGYLTSIPANTTHSQWYMAPPNWATYQTVQSNLGTSNFHISTYVGTTTTAKAYTDSTLGLSNSGTFTAGYLTCLANYSCADTRWFNGDIAEVIAYSGTLTDAERLRIEGYLKAKYNL